MTAPTPTGDIPGVTRRHRPSDFYHERTNFQFIKHSRRWAIISGTLVLLSFVCLFTRGQSGDALEAKRRRPLICSDERKLACDLRARASVRATRHLPGTPERSFKRAASQTISGR